MRALWTYSPTTVHDVEGWIGGSGVRKAAWVVVRMTASDGEAWEHIVTARLAYMSLYGCMEIHAMAVECRRLVVESERRIREAHYAYVLDSYLA